MHKNSHTVRKQSQLLMPSGPGAWAGWLYSKLWDKWPYLPYSFSFVASRYMCVCMYVFSSLKTNLNWDAIWTSHRYEWNRSDLLLFEVKKETAHFPAYVTVTGFCPGVWAQKPTWPCAALKDFVGKGGCVKGGFELMSLVKFMILRSSQHSSHILNSIANTILHMKKLDSREF